MDQCLNSRGCKDASKAVKGAVPAALEVTAALEVAAAVEVMKTPATTPSR